MTEQLTMNEGIVDRLRLTEAFPQTAIKQREATRGGIKLDYVEGHTVIHRLNDSADWWDFSIKELHTSVIGRDKDGNDIVLVRAHVALTLPGMGTREHIGVQTVRANAGEDLVKGAVTDALKKAATLFGVGLELYGPDYGAGEVPVVDQRNSSQTSNGNHQSSRGNQQQGNGRDWVPSAAQVRFARALRDELNLFEAYPDEKINSMGGREIKNFIDEQKAIRDQR